MRENELPSNAELNLDDLDVVAGGAGGADVVELDGQVAAALPNALFQVQLDNGSSVTCRISGQPRIKYVRIQPGDRMRVQTSPGDPSRGRIINLHR
jgi:translation initiation factor IF-1